MELRVLGYFLTVAREENITKAAALLHITQPTLSRQLMQLEEELGVKLFRRSNHSTAPTEQGMLLKRRAQELVSLAEKTKQELGQREQLSGELSIGSGEYQNSRLLAEILAAFHESHSAVQFEVYGGNSDDIKERIERGTLKDVGFLLEPVDVGGYQFVRSPLKEESGIFSIGAFRSGGQGTCRSRRIWQDRPLIFARRDLIKKEIIHWFGEYADRLQIVASGNLPYNLAALGKREMGDFLNLKPGLVSTTACGISRCSPNWRAIRCWPGKRIRPCRLWQVRLSALQGNTYTVSSDDINISILHFL